MTICEKCGASHTKTERDTEIHRRWRQGERQCDLAEAFGISRSRVFQICHKTGKRLHRDWLKNKARPRIMDPDFPDQEYKGVWIVVCPNYGG